MSQASPVIRKMSDVVASIVDRSRGATIQVLIGPEDNAPNFFTRRFTLEPGGRIPKHMHEDIEHEQVMLEGELTLGLDDEQRVVRAGEVVFIPADVAHWYENRTLEPVRFLCMIPRTEGYRTQWFEPEA